ncbi:BphX family protein [Agromyces aerolatus]|uniref:BphX family protein n=1 Tax=Agromyces sp. LY-1074 TaxID=3074080 RepID=UPI00285B466D|nr:MULTISPECIES: BphX family protein [unclassified Agromyces]MDR5700265.1 BphX family protein [Agromyces sp. LY-1074]MDR5706757.1 BphX family protein [Agromyces sp. LY-1358]
MKFLTWWFRVVGLVNIVLGIMWLPFLNAARLELSIPGWDAPIGGAAYRGFLDYMLLFGLDLIILGVFLVVASFRPGQSRILAWLAIGLSAVRGVLDDVYMIAAGYPLGAMLAFIALHTAIIVTGLLALRAASRGAKGPIRSSATHEPAVSGRAT